MVCFSPLHRRRRSAPQPDTLTDPYHQPNPHTDAHTAAHTHPHDHAYAAPYQHLYGYPWTQPHCFDHSYPHQDVYSVTSPPQCYPNGDEHAPAIEYTRSAHGNLHTHANAHEHSDEHSYTTCAVKEATPGQ